jgi:hypothetical protein
MKNQLGEFQAKIYLYDLNNCAREFGFKADEVWEVSLATDEEKVAIEKKYFPTISAKALPEILSEMFGLVKDKLAQARSDIEMTLDKKKIAASKLQYLIAFNLKRER